MTDGGGAPCASQVSVTEVSASNLMILPTGAVSGVVLYHSISRALDAIDGTIGPLRIKIR